MSDAGTNPGAEAAAGVAGAHKAAWALYIIVLVSGAVLMGVEIAGARILAPGFGTSTYVWGSIIGLFMAALAAGYYLGGALADRKPSFGVLACIVCAAGILTCLIPRFGPTMCNYVALKDLGPVFGPLFAAGAIFFVPSFLMGMITPYAVKLHATSLAKLGGAAGRIYALSTFGSIVGTLGTTFVLIPAAGVSHVFQALGITLMVVAACGFLLFRMGSGGVTALDKGNAGVVALLALGFAEAWAVFPVDPHLYRGQRLLHYEDSAYHEILVTEDVFEEQKSGNILQPARVWNSDAPELRNNGIVEVKRWLKFNENIESGIFPYRTEHKNAVNYTDLLHLPLIWINDPLPQKVLVVGGGGGVVPTQYADWYDSEAQVAEIDAAVERVARAYFQVPQTPKIPPFIIGDGRQTIKRLPEKSYDIIFLDAYSSGGQIPFHLLTWEFLAEVKSRLTDRGVLLTNIISGVKNVATTRAPRPADLFLAEYKTLTASRFDVTGDPNDDKSPLFKQVYVFPKVWPRSPLVGEAFEEYRNVIVVATREDRPRTLEELESAIKKLTAEGKPVIKAPQMLWHVQHMYKGPDAAELASVPVLRDDYAPVDTMYRAVKRDEASRYLYVGW
jgi:predicted membrane-bound spermidine synthase